MLRGDADYLSTHVSLREEIRQKLKQRFKMSQKVDNIPEELLGMRVTIEPGMVEIDQSRYALEVYNNYRDKEIEIRVATTPMKESTKLNKANHDPEYMVNKDYRGMVGSILYLTMVTRPDICYAVKELSRMLDSPGEEVLEPFALAVRPGRSPWGCVRPFASPHTCFSPHTRGRSPWSRSPLTSRANWQMQLYLCSRFIEQHEVDNPMYMCNRR